MGHGECTDLFTEAQSETSKARYIHSSSTSHLEHHIVEYDATAVPLGSMSELHRIFT